MFHVSEGCEVLMKGTFGIAAHGRKMTNVVDAPLSPNKQTRRVEMTAV